MKNENDRKITRPTLPTHLAHPDYFGTKATQTNAATKAL
jgi:hypothetical protein